MWFCSCKKSDNITRPCHYDTLGKVYDRNIPDSVSVDSIVVIGVYWKKVVPCQKFLEFRVDTFPNESRRIFLQTLVDTCNCYADTSLLQWKYYKFKPDTVGRYPIKVNAFFAGFFVDTITVY